LLIVARNQPGRERKTRKLFHPDRVDLLLRGKPSFHTKIKGLLFTVICVESCTLVGIHRKLWGPAALVVLLTVARKRWGPAALVLLTVACLMNLCPAAVGPLHRETHLLGRQHRAVTSLRNSEDGWSQTLTDTIIDLGRSVFHQLPLSILEFLPHPQHRRLDHFTGIDRMEHDVVAEVVASQYDDEFAIGGNAGETRERQISTI